MKQKNNVADSLKECYNKSKYCEIFTDSGGCYYGF